jgi:hypothetical protein
MSDEQGSGGERVAGGGATHPLKIFINYRREEASFPAHRLYEDLADHFGEEQVFIDVDTIEPGLPFDEVIEREVGSCDVLLVMIGPHWLELTDEAGRRRLDKPDDYVRLEVEAALGRGVRVIPALLREAGPPSSDQLPESLKRLSRLQALPLSDDRRWREDVERLIRLLKKLQEVKAQAAEEETRQQQFEQGRAAREAAEQAALDLAEQELQEERREQREGDAREQAARLERERVQREADERAARERLAREEAELAKRQLAERRAAEQAERKRAKQQAHEQARTRSQSSEQGSRTRLWLVAAGVAILIGGAAALALLTRGGSGPPLFVRQLLVHVPPAIRDRCRAQASVPAGATAGVSCGAGPSQVVSYFAFRNSRAMNRYYADRVDGGGLARKSGTCGEEPFRGEGSYTIEGRPAGRVYCGATETGAFVGWTDTGAHIGSRASRSDANQAALADWWSTSAGPLASAERSVAAKSAKVPRGTVVYRDTFSKRNGWLVSRNASGALGYSGGGYRIVVRKANQALAATTADFPDDPLAFGDVGIRVSARRVGGPQAYGFGIVCRRGPTLYALQVRSDGLLRIRKAVRGSFRDVAQQRLGHPVSRAELSAGCRGGGTRPVSLSVSVNGSQALTFKDRSSSTTGAVGVLAQSLDRPGVAVRFDDLSVTAG